MLRWCFDIGLLGQRLDRVARLLDVGADLPRSGSSADARAPEQAGTGAGLLVLDGKLGLKQLKLLSHQPAGLLGQLFDRLRCGCVTVLGSAHDAGAVSPCPGPPAEELHAGRLAGRHVGAGTSQYEQPPIRTGPEKLRAAEVRRRARELILYV